MTTQPTDNTPLQGQWALVTGASSGLGVDFAKELAKRGANLILVARRQDKLETVQADITATYGVEVDVVVMDLAERDAPERLYEQLRAAGKQVDILVNNAGFGAFGDFLAIDWDKERAMLDLDIITVVQMSKLFAKDMVARGYGRLLQIASTGGFQPTPLYASYSAAKSFVLYWSNAISFELRETGVSNTVISPGITRTEFLQVTGQTMTRYQRLTLMESSEVARIGIDAMLRGQASIVPGLVNRLTAWSTRFMPYQLSAWIAKQLMKNS